MPTSYTTNLRLANPGLGDTGWGSTVSNGMIALTDQAIAGVVDVDVTASNVTLTSLNGAVDQARAMALRVFGGAVARNVVVPTTSKLYVVQNDCTAAIQVKTSVDPGALIPAGHAAIVRVDPTVPQVVFAIDYLQALSLGSALAATSGGTGQTGYAVGDIVYASSTTALSKLPIGATNAILTVAAGIPSWTNTLGVASGGTGAATLAANNVLLGNGTSAVQTVAPGTAGNLLTSSGGTWVSAPPPAGGVTSLNSQTGAVVTTGFGDIGSVAVLMIATNTNLAVGDTIAGSDLRHSWTANFGAMAYNGYTPYANNYGNTSNVYNGGGTALTGIWRKVSTGSTYFSTGGAFPKIVAVCCGFVIQTSSFPYVWAAALYVRVS